MKRLILAVVLIILSVSPLYADDTLATAGTNKSVIYWMGTDYLLHTFKMADGLPRMSMMPYLYSIAESEVVYHNGWSKLGYNGDLSTFYEDIIEQGGTYTPPTGETVLEIVSSNAGDSLGGTGIRTLTIYYLDSTFTERSLTVNMQGTSETVTAKADIYRINYVDALTVGSGGSAAGNIQIRSVGDSPIYGYIGTGHTKMRQAFYTVPKDRVLYITSVTAGAGSSVGNRAVIITTRATWDDNADTNRTFFYAYSELLVQDGMIPRPLEIPTRFYEGTDLKVSAISPDGVAYGSVALRGWLENEE